MPPSGNPGVTNWGEISTCQGKFPSGGKFKGDSGSDMWYQPLTVKLFFSLILLCSVTSCQCLQQTGACLWFQL